MSDRDQTPSGPPAEHEEESLRRLFESAGPRAEIPQEDLDAIATAARMAWKRVLMRRAAERRRVRSRGIFAALAATLVLAIGLAWWWSSGDLDELSGSARVEAAMGPVFLELGGEVRRSLAVGDLVPVGALVTSARFEDRVDEQPGRASLRLANGLVLRVDTGTELRLAAAAAIELQHGAVYLDSGLAPGLRGSLTGPPDRRPGRPRIEVRTPFGTARDVGTQFAVRIVDTADESLRIRVREGRVETERAGHTYSATVGEELVLAADGTVERRPVAGFGPQWDWVLAAAPAFDAEGRTLREFLDWTARETGWHIRLEDRLAETAGDIVLHGDLSGLRPDHALFTVLPGAGLEAQLQGQELIIRRQR